MGNVRSNFGGGFAMVHYSIMDMLGFGKVEELSENGQIDSYALTVWTYLVRASNEGFTVRRMKTISDATGIGLTTVKLRVKMLECVGLLRVIRRQAEDGSWLANEYELVPPSPQRPHGRETTPLPQETAGGPSLDDQHIENSSYLDIQPTRAREADGIPDSMAEHFGLTVADPAPEPVVEDRDLIAETEWIFRQWPPDRVNEPEVQRLYLGAKNAGRLPPFAEVQRNVLAWRSHEDFREGYRYSLTRMIETGRLWRHPNEANAPPVAVETRPDPGLKPIREWRLSQAQMLAEEAEASGDMEKLEFARNLERERHGWKGAAA